MPYREKTVEKLYWSIGEVGVELGVNASLIRFWEKQFGTIKPRRTSKGDRLYTRKEIDHLRTIQHLVKEKGFTLNGAREQMRNNEPTPPDKQGALSAALLKVRDSLLEIRDTLDQSATQ